MEITEALQQLAKFSHQAFPVVSVYFNTQWSDRHERAQSTAFLASHLRQARALDLASEAASRSLTEDLARIEQWGRRLISDTNQAPIASAALFTCSGADLWVEFPSPMPFENEFTIADRPALRQLIRLDAEYTNALVVLLDAYGARICEVVLGEFLAETDFGVQTAKPRRNWGHLRYRRQAKADVHRHYREVAEYLTTSITKRPSTSIVLSGPDDAVGAVRELLPQQVQSQIISEVTFDMRETYARILSIAQETLQAHERQEDQESVQLLLDSAGRGGLATLGLQDTLIALNAGLVHRLIMCSDFRRHGWRCLDCDNIGSEEPLPPQCTVCNGQVLAVELGEAMATEVLRADGFVDPVEADARLASYDGIGALLRYK